MAAANSNCPPDDPAPSSRRARRTEETGPHNSTARRSPYPKDGAGAADRSSPYARDEAEVRPSPYDAEASNPHAGSTRPPTGSRRRPTLSRPTSRSSSTSRPSTARSSTARPGLADRLAERLDRRRNKRVLTLGQKAFGMLAVTGMVLTGAVVAAGTSSAEVPLTRATFASNSRWHWVDDVALGRTNSSDQYAQAQVSGLRSREHAAAFFMRYKNKNDKIFVAVSGTEWRIQGSGARPLVGRFRHASTGTFRVEVRGQSVRVLWDNKVVTTQKLTRTYSGKAVIASIWQSSRSVRMTNVEASSLAGGTTTPTTTSSQASVTEAPATVVPTSTASVSGSVPPVGSEPNSATTPVTSTDTEPSGPTITPTTTTLPADPTITTSTSSSPWTSTTSTTIPPSTSISTSTTVPTTTTPGVTTSSVTVVPPPVTTTSTTTSKVAPTTTITTPKTSTSTSTSSATVTSSSTTTAPVTTVPSDGSKRWYSGAAGENMSNGQWESWRGSRAGIAGSWEDTRAAQTDLWSICSGPYAASSWNRPLDLAIGGIYHSAGENWSAAANGAYDARWTQVLSKAKGCWGTRPAGNLYIRFAHEMNLTNDWKVAAGEEDKFVATFRRIVAIRDRVFPGAKLVFAPNEGSAGGSGDVRKLWPGKDASGKNYADGYVVDMYNHWPFADTVSEFDAKANQVAGDGAPVGIEKHRLYAESLGAWFGMGEWSNAAYNADGGGGGESPVFVAELNKWLRSHAGDVNNPRPGQVVYDVQFNLWDQYQFWSTTKQPQTAKQYASIPWGQ